MSPCQHLVLFDKIPELTWIELSAIQVVCAVQGEVLMAKELPQYQLLDGRRVSGSAYIASWGNFTGDMHTVCEITLCKSVRGPNSIDKRILLDLELNRLNMTRY